MSDAEKLYYEEVIRILKEIRKDIEGMLNRGECK